MKQFKRQGCSIMVGSVPEINERFGIPSNGELDWSVLNGAKIMTLEPDELRALADLLDGKA